MKYGPEVGYQIRFEKHRNVETKILFITEGLLLGTTGNCLASHISTVRITFSDEYVIICRPVTRACCPIGDFLLGITKCILHQRTDMKLVLMSATINIELFADYFGDMAKVIQVGIKSFGSYTHSLSQLLMDRFSFISRFRDVCFRLAFNTFLHQSSTKRTDSILHPTFVCYS